MTALISAELLRLRTVRSPRYAALGVLAFVAAITASNLDPSAAGARQTQGELADSLRSLVLPGVFMAGALAATQAATEFQFGTTALTYLSHPDRARVATARALVYAGVGFVLAALAAGVVLAVGVPAAGAENVSFSASDVARMVGGAACGGAAMGAVGALLGTAVRNPTIASSVVPGWYVVELILMPVSIRPYLPFGLVNSLMGHAGAVTVPAASVLLLAYVAAAALLVGRWALPRDLT
jgi:ABC-2 type transport system permease protein